MPSLNLNKKDLIGIIVLLVVASILFLGGIFNKVETPTTSQEEGRAIGLIRSDSYSITTKERPYIVQAAFDPLNVFPGETQNVEVSIENDVAVDSVSVTMILDDIEEPHEMQLSQGDNLRGVWSGSWVVSDHSFNKNYQAKIQARSGEDMSEVVITFI